MAVGNKQLFVWSNGRQIVDSKLQEIIFKAIAVSADGESNGLNISESSGKFDFNAKVLGNIGAGSAAGQALSFSQIGANNGVAGLDSGGKVPVAQLPNSIMEYKGAFDPFTHVPNLKNAAVKSLKVIQDLTYAAKTAGVAGDLITITYVSDVTQGNETAAAVGNVFTVHIETAVSTATQIKAAVDAAAVLVDVTISGTGGTAQTTVTGVALEGGRDLADIGDVWKATAVGTHDFGAGGIVFAIGDYAIFNGTVFEKAHSGADAVVSVNGEAGAVVLDADDISDTATTKKFYTATQARSDLIAASITDNDTTHAPDGNSVFDALAGKSSTGHDHSGVYAPISHSHAIGDVTGLTTALSEKDATASRYASYTNKEGVEITIRQFVFMSAAGEVQLLTSADTVGEDTIFGCVQAATIANDAAGNIWLPEMGTRITGFTSLTVGSKFWAHATVAGSYVTTRPTTGKSIYLGYAASATDIIFVGKYEHAFV
jgi:hypothetical protein